jgi:hypothetical protein
VTQRLRRARCGAIFHVDVGEHEVSAKSGSTTCVSHKITLIPKNLNRTGRVRCSVKKRFVCGAALDPGSCAWPVSSARWHTIK